MSDPLRPYAHLYASPKGPGDQRPKASQVIQDENLLGKLQGMVILITGGTSGIGRETARVLHTTGADIFITARDIIKGQAVVEEIKQKSSGKGKIEVIEMNLDSLDCVRQAARSFLEKSDKLNVLINNAGIMACPESQTKDGVERQFGVNYLGHFLLTSLLLPTLISSSTSARRSRVVNVSSTSHRFSKVHWDNINFAKAGSYDPQVAYAQSKTAQIWHANYLDRHYGTQGVRGLSLHPGGLDSGLQVYTDPAMLEGIMAEPEFSKYMGTAEQIATTPVWAAVSRALEDRGGLYLADCGITEKTDNVAFLPLPDAAPFINEPDSEDRLWNLSVGLIRTKSKT